jgi:hypothetical protein
MLGELQRRYIRRPNIDSSLRKGPRRWALTDCSRRHPRRQFAWKARGSAPERWASKHFEGQGCVDKPKQIRFFEVLGHAAAILRGEKYIMYLGLGEARHPRFPLVKPVEMGGGNLQDWPALVSDPCQWANRTHGEVPAVTGTYRCGYCTFRPG